MLRVPALAPLFADTGMLTYPIDSLNAGIDPYLSRATNPWHSIYNYPPIWLELRHLGIDTRSTTALGTVFAAMTITSLLLLLRAKRVISGVVCFLAVTSWPVLFVVERGNIDEVIFFLLVGGFFLVETQKPRIRAFFHAGLVVMLTVLKIYPAVIGTVLLRGRRGWLKFLAVEFVALGTLVITCGHRLGQILLNTPREVLASYGSLPFFFFAVKGLSPALALRVRENHELATVGALMMGLAATLCAVPARRMIQRILPPIDLDSARGCVAMACTAIFCFTFLLGSNYDYRLLFILGILGYLIEDLNQSRSFHSLPACIFLLAYLSLASPSTAYRLRLPFEVLDAALYMFGCAWLAITLLEERDLLPDRRRLNSVRL